MLMQSKNELLLQREIILRDQTIANQLNELCQWRLEQTDKSLKEIEGADQNVQENI